MLVEEFFELLSRRGSAERFDEVREITADDLGPPDFDLLALYELRDELPGSDEPIHAGGSVASNDARCHARYAIAPPRIANVTSPAAIAIVVSGGKPPGHVDGAIQLRQPSAVT